MSAAAGRPVGEQIQRLLRLYIKGVYTEMELVSQLSALAEHPGFFDHLHLIPAEHQEKLRRIAQNAAAHPEDVFLLRSYCGRSRSQDEIDRQDENDRQAAYESARRLREHYYANDPLPPFEPIRFIGTVDESVRMDDAVIVFGNMRCWLIRRHPVRCVRPDGTTLNIRVTRWQVVKRANDENSADPLVRRHGRVGLILDDMVQTPCEVPPGSQLYVDRAGVQPLRAPGPDTRES